MVNLDVLFLLSFFFSFFFAGTQIDAAHFVLIISPFVRDIRQKRPQPVMESPRRGEPIWLSCGDSRTGWIMSWTVAEKGEGGWGAGGAERCCSGGGSGRGVKR